MKNGRSIQSVEEEYISNLDLLEDPSSVCDYLLMLGMEHQGHEEIQREEYRIPGCKSVIWCEVTEGKGKIFLKMDSDSLLIKGVLHIMEDLYDGRSEEEIESHPLMFLEHIPAEVIYEEIRHNGLKKCYGKMIEKEGE